MAADSEMEKNVTNGFLAQNSIIFQKNTTFPFIGKKITNSNFATIQHILINEANGDKSITLTI